jgi:glycosyltransferase involved in cell wall biosynthesis
VSVLSLIKAQQELGDHHIGLLAGVTPSDVPVSTIVGPDVDIHTVRVLGRPVSWRYGLEFVVRSLLQASHWAKAFRPTILHGHSGRWHYSLATRLLARRLDCHWVHTLYCPILQRRTCRRIENWVIRETLGGAAAIVGISQNIVRSLAQVGLSTRRLYHIDPCIETAQYLPTGSSGEVRKHLDIPPNAQVVLYVGNAHPAKGFDILLDAIAALRARGPDPYLVATFESSGRSYATEMAEQLDDKDYINARFLGVVENMPSLLQAADVLVVPFRNTIGPSDYPLPMLEAMAVGTPVITANVGGICEVIRDRQTGLLVPPESPSRLASALEELLTGTVSGGDLADHARDLVHERFAPSVGARKWKELYEEI